MRCVKNLSWVLAIAISLASFQTLANGPISKSGLSKVAIGGSDSVAYRSDQAATSHQHTKGKKNWVVEWRGAKWRFASEENYLAFKANPEKYRPAYGGHCANALSLGEGLIRTDGSHWEIFDDELHLFFAGRGRDRWLNGNQAQYKQEADAAWKEITGFNDD